MALGKGHQPIGVRIQIRDFCTQQLLFASTTDIFIVVLRSEGAPCTRGRILLLAAENTAVSVIHVTHSLLVVAQFTAKLGENAANKGAIVELNCISLVEQALKMTLSLRKF